MLTKFRTCFVVLMFVSLLGCAHSNKAPSPEIQTRSTPLSLSVPQLGSIQLPDQTPYAIGSRSESAYFDGFSVGWRIIQRAGEGGLVYAPNDYSADDELREAWHKGVADGTSSAYERFVGEGAEEDARKNID